MPANVLIVEQQQLFIANADAAQYANATMHLSQTQPTFNPNLTPANLAIGEATYSGYANITISGAGPAFPDPVNGGVSFMIPTTTFQVAANATVGNDIVGGWVQNANGTLLLMAWNTPNPWSMQESFEALPVEALLNLFGSVNGTIQYAGVPQ